MFNVGCSMFDVWEFGNQKLEEHRTLNVEHPTSKGASRSHPRFCIRRPFAQNFPGLKGRHNQAQGNALGLMSQNIKSPERAK
jgi:hypothetical protein